MSDLPNIKRGEFMWRLEMVPDIKDVGFTRTRATLADLLALRAALPDETHERLMDQDQRERAKRIGFTRMGFDTGTSALTAEKARAIAAEALLDRLARAAATTLAAGGKIQNKTALHSALAAVYASAAGKAPPPEPATRCKHCNDGAVIMLPSCPKCGFIAPEVGSGKLSAERGNDG